MRILALLLLTNYSTVAQPSWELLSTTTRPSDLYAVVGNRIYAGIAPATNELWVYDLASREWTRKADFPGMMRDGGTTFVLSNKIYYCAGRSNRSTLLHYDLWIYDPVLDRWSTAEPFPGGGRYNGTAFVIDDKAYFGMGYNGIYMRDLWEYDAEKNSWSEKTSIPRRGKGRENPFSFSLGGKGYVGCGKASMNPDFFTNEVWEYDPTTDQWNQIADFPIEGAGAAAFALDNRGYVVGGIDGELKPNYSTWLYNPCQNTWTRHQDFLVTDWMARGALVGRTSYLVTTVGEAYFWRLPPSDSLGFASIEAITPTQALPGSMINLTGSNFSPQREDNMVTLNGSPCVVTEATQTQLTIVIPQQATSGLLAVQVNCGEILTAATPFFVLQPAPWWLSWWAIVGYTALAGGFVYMGRESVKRSERKKLQTELDAREAETIRKTEQLKAKFFSNITHEFRTPLTLIQGPAQELFERASDAKSQKLAQMIQENSNRLLKLINQLLDLAKLDAQEMKLNVSAVDLNKRIHTIHAQFTSLASSRQIILRKEFGHLPTVSVDADKLEVILNNLLSNAIKFTPNGGQVTLEANYGAGQLVVRVADNGRGIPNDQLPFIFNRFYQINPSDSSHAEGTGIGLALVREYTELMGGVIHVESHEGTGTTFQVELTLALSADLDFSPLQKLQPDSLPSAEELFAEEGRPLILLIEDNSDIRAFVKECLGPHYRYTESADGNVGLQTSQQLIPDLILCDWMMPGMDGLEVCTLVKQDLRTNHIPFVMLTAKAAEENRHEGLKGGADEYLVKPFNKIELKFKVDNLLNLRKNLQAHVRRELLAMGLPATPQSESDRFVCQARLFVETNLSSEHLNVELLAGAMNLSREQCYRKLMALTGLSPSAFIRTLRLQRAMDLLRANWGPVSQVAYEVGFDNLSHFSKAFHIHFGHLPSAIQKTQAG